MFLAPVKLQRNFQLGKAKGVLYFRVKNALSLPSSLGPVVEACHRQ